jgi:hypothetical protein
MCLLFVLFVALPLPGVYGLYRLPYALIVLLCVLRLQDGRRLQQKTIWEKITLTGFVLWIVAATVAYVATASDLQSFYNYLGLLFGLVMYICLRGMTLTSREASAVLLGLAVAIAISFAPPLKAYYDAFGIPDPVTLLESHFEVGRMEKYEALTYGNTSSTAGMIVLLIPGCIAEGIKRTRPLMWRACFGCAAGLMLLNLVIVESRTAFLMLILMVAAISYFYGKMRIIVVIAVGALALVALRSGGEDSRAWSLFSTRLKDAITLNSVRDVSVRDRQAAIQDGWNKFERNWTTGIGIGNSTSESIYGAAHQFNVEQAEELGILGLIASILVLVGLVGRFVYLLKLRRSFDTDIRFSLLIGPSCYLIFGAIANISLNYGQYNSWIATAAALAGLSEFRRVSGGTISNARTVRRRRLVRSQHGTSGWLGNPMLEAPSRIRQ